MNKGREEVGDFLGIHARPVFQPAAQAVDTYVGPAPQQETKAQALQKVLATLDSSLSPTLRKESRKAAQREFDEGEELFQKTRTDFAEAVRTGQIPAGASPFVRRGYRASQLHVLGATYNVELQRALEHSNLHEVDNPAEVEQFIQAFNEKFAQANNLEGLPDREVHQVFRPLAKAANDRFRAKQAADNIEFVEEKRFRSFEAELHLALTQGRFTGPEGSASADAKNVSQWLQARAQEMYEEGLDYKLIERSILSAVGETAMQRGSIGVGGLLNGISIGGMPSLGSTPAGRKVKDQIRKAVAARETATNKKAAKEAKAEKEKMITALEAEAQEAARAGNLLHAESVLDELNKVAPSKARAVDSFIRRYDADFDDFMKKEVFSGALEEVRHAGTMTEARLIIDEAVVFGKLTPEDANSLEGIAKRRLIDTDGSDPVTMMENDKYLMGVQKSMKVHFPTNEFGIPLPENAAALARAEAYYEDSVLGWIADNSDEDGRFDRLQARAWAQQAQKEALQIYGPTNNSSQQSPPSGIPAWAQ